MHKAVSDYGDFLDVEWQFVDADDSSELARQILRDEATNPAVILTLCVCSMNDKRNIESVLHLPEEVYGRAQTTTGAKNIAVYIKDSHEVVRFANLTGMFSDITVFGPNAGDYMKSLTARSRYGKRVNYVYDQKYGNPPSPNIENAWYKCSESDKSSSIYCANAMFLRNLCFDMNGDRMPVYEAEHRRWVMSELIMGFKPGKIRDKQYFIHNDIIPFDELPEKEKVKDQDIIDAMPDIIKE